MMINVLMNVSPCCLHALIETFLGCLLRGRRVRDGMAVVSSNAVYGELYSIQHYVIGRWFSPGTSVSSTNKSDSHDITKILLKVALNTITPNLGCFINRPGLFNSK